MEGIFTLSYLSAFKERRKGVCGETLDKGNFTV